jgi:hypothetical protein
MNGTKIYQHFPIQGPPKCSQIWIFGSKRNHLATLPAKSSSSRPIQTICAIVKRPLLRVANFESCRCAPTTYEYFLLQYGFLAGPRKPIFK